MFINICYFYKMKLSFLLVAFFLQLNTFAQLTPFEKGNKNTTPTYYEIIDFYKKLDKQSNLVTMQEAGPTDAGLPLHVVYVQQPVLAKNAVTIFINNGIHPGEPDGIDASMLLVRDVITKKIALPNTVRLAIIPVYNIGGCLNRSANYRVDQNGPEEFGFRGNSQNLDLNRDFIKNDSKEAKSFCALFQQLKPQIFIDNHVSNGADYQHIITLLTTQHNKLGGIMGNYLQNVMEPAIYKMMQQKNYDLVPYVNFFGETPEQGWTEFYDSPRYSSGYAAMWHCFAFVPETHMLKPYAQRVDATLQLMECFIDFAIRSNSTILNKQQQQIEWYAKQSNIDIDWMLDKTKDTTITFKGYESGKKESLISRQPRLFYDRNKLFTKQIKFANTYKASNTITKPKAYIIPQGWWKVIELLKNNNIKMVQFLKDTTIKVELYKIIDFKSSASAYESHHANNSVKTETLIKNVFCRKGDYYITTNQTGCRFLLETLEPTARDSYFCWNYFDGILGQKEGFSNYVFEETALQYLKEDANLKSALDAKKVTDEKFAKDGEAQLDFIYKNSKYFETNYMHYPVYRVMQ